MSTGNTAVDGITKYFFFEGGEGGGVRKCQFSLNNNWKNTNHVTNVDPVFIWNIMKHKTLIARQLLRCQLYHFTSCSWYQLTHVEVQLPE